MTKLITLLIPQTLGGISKALPGASRSVNPRSGMAPCASKEKQEVQFGFIHFFFFSSRRYSTQDPDLFLDSGNF